MKQLQASCHFEFAERIVEILDARQIRDYVRIPMVEGKDHHGKHEGTQVFPGNLTAIHAQVPEDRVDAVLEDLGDFKAEKEAHHHVQAIILPIERRLNDVDQDGTQ